MTEESQTGKGSLLGAALTVVGLLAARHPEWGRVVFISQHTAEVTEISGYVVASLGQVWIFISHPPAWLRDPIMDRVYWIKASIAQLKAKFARKVAP